MPAHWLEREPHCAWVILAACAVRIGMAFGAIVNISVFLKPLAAAFGRPRCKPRPAGRTQAVKQEA